MPRSRSTSRIVSGKFLLMDCFTTLSTDEFGLFIGEDFGTGVAPGTVNREDDPLLLVQSTEDATTDADNDTSSLSKLNSLCESLSNAL